MDLVYRIAGQPRTRLRQISPLIIRIMSVANRTLRELLEMQYQFEEPFIVDSAKIISELGAGFTPLEQALTETVEFYQAARAAANGTR